MVSSGKPPEKSIARAGFSRDVGNAEISFGYLDGFKVQPDSLRLAEPLPCSSGTLDKRVPTGHIAGSGFGDKAVYGENRAVSAAFERAGLVADAAARLLPCGEQQEMIFKIGAVLAGVSGGGLDKRRAVQIKAAGLSLDVGCERGGGIDNGERRFRRRFRGNRVGADKDRGTWRNLAA